MVGEQGAFLCLFKHAHLQAMNDNDRKLPNNGWWIVAVFIIAMIIVMLVMAVTASAEEIAGRASVIDGDTIEIHVKRIRL